MQVLEIIRAYQREAAAFVSSLRAHYAIEHLLSGVRSGTVPWEGRFTSADGRAYQFRFHGAGCRFGYGGVDVDFDFGPAERCDGFDAWRLALYCQSRHIPMEESSLQSELEQLAARGLIHQPGWPPGISLWYFRDQAVGE